jgi:hypothetical protein
MGASSFLSFAMKNPPGATLKKARAALARAAERRRARARDARFSTFPQNPEPGSHSLNSLLPRIPLEHLRARAPLIAAEARMLLEHRFDLLGSGPVRVERGMRCSGLEGIVYPPGEAAKPDPEGRWLREVVNPANFPECARLWRMVSPGYVPIDWQLDFKSGFRWSERTWSPDIEYGKARGADIKVPWELARMQHLPRLGFAFALATDGAEGFAPPDVYAREFNDELLDFAACNPPRYGANWVCAMDAAIRAANMLLAGDIFIASGARFSEDFERSFARFIRSHGEFIAANLEWNPSFRSNHYLSDIGGLLFTAAYLPPDDLTDAWLAFAARELRDEFFLQFNADGSNFEASTSYHRLSLEIVLYAAGLALGLPQERAGALRRGGDSSAAHPNPRVDPLELHKLPSGRVSPFPPSFFERAAQAVVFSMDVARPDNRVAQIGDNDSGRFFKLSLAKQASDSAGSLRFEENHLDHRHLAAAAAGLFRSDALRSFGAGHEIETEIMKALAGLPGLDFAPPSPPSSAGKPDALERALAEADMVPASRRIVSVHESGSNLREGLEARAYPDFGLYILRSPALFMAVRCGSVGQLGNGGHAHNDQLAVELVIEGRVIFADPGSYLYTPLPERRNEYRSARAHAAPLVARGGEPGRLDLGLFRLDDRAFAKCLHFSNKGFAGSHSGFGAPVFRSVEVLDRAVRITDFSPTLELEKNPPPPPFSPGYGRIETG